ncbi:MAG: hypothetical protein ACO1RA_00025 [Planctomycetaceae bacterium]
MYFWLLWILLAVCGGLVAAWWVAVAARIRHGVPRYLLLLIVVAAGMVPAWILGEFVSNWGNTPRILESPIIGYFALVATFIGTMIYLAIKGFRKHEGNCLAVKWSRWKLALGAAVSFAGAVLVFWLMDQAAKQRLIAWDKELQTEQEKHVAPLVGTEEDPYLIYEKIVADFPDEVYLLYKEAKDKNPNDHIPASVVSDPESIAYVKRSEPLIEEIRRATLLPSLRNQSALKSFGDEFSDSQKNRFIGLKIAFILTLNIRVHASQGNLRRALEEVAILQQLSEQAAQYKMVAGQMESLQYQRFALRDLEYLLQNYRVSDADLNLVSLESKTTIKDRLVEVYPLDKIMGTRFEIDRELGRREMPPHLESKYRFELMPRRALNAFYSQKWFESELSAIRSGLKFPAVDEARLRQNNQNSLRTTDVNFAGRFLPSGLTTLYTIGVRNDVERQVARVAVAAYRYTIRNGDFPETLEVLREMDPEMSLADPYSNGLLKMLRKDNMLTIFSVGPNGTDDGGVPYSRDQGKELGDLPFTIGKGTARN